MVNHARGIQHRFSRFWNKAGYRLTPAPLVPAIPPGFWRQHPKTAEEHALGLFDTLLVALPGNENSWNALDAALFISRNEQASVNGLTIVPKEASRNDPSIGPIRRRFMERCQLAGIEGRMAVEAGSIPRVIYERSFWVDLILIPLDFPLVNF